MCDPSAIVELEDKVRELVAEFQSRTGTVVDSIDVQSFVAADGNRKSRVYVRPIPDPVRPSYGQV